MRADKTIDSNTVSVCEPPKFRLTFSKIFLSCSLIVYLKNFAGIMCH